MKRTTASFRAWWLLLLVLLAAATPAAFLLFSYSSRGAPPPLAEPGQKSTADTSVSKGVSVIGQVDLIHGVTALYPLQPGRVAEVLVEEGQTVAEGTVLVRLEDREVRSRVAEAQAALDEAELRLKKARKLPEQQTRRIAQQKDAVEAARARRDAAKRQLAHQRKLAKDELTNASDLAVSEDHVREVEAMLRGEEKRLEELKQEDIDDDIHRAEKEVEVMKSRRDQARFALEECALKAPRRGSVLRLLIGPGDVLSSQPKQPAIQFAIEGPLVVRANVEQEFVGRIAVGQRARIEDETHADQVWKGKVERIANWIARRRSVLHEPFDFNDVRTAETLITLEPGQPPLRIGQRVRVRVGSQNH